MLAPAISSAEFVMLAECGDSMTTGDEAATSRAIRAHLARAGTSWRSAA
ncbi:MAG: hypothetical protein H0T43_12005 [Solirubrobacterales bacterium]|nr:hypothetical protein [Solirubrobacterales bacterium]